MSISTPPSGEETAPRSITLRSGYAPAAAQVSALATMTAELNSICRCSRCVGRVETDRRTGSDSTPVSPPTPITLAPFEATIRSSPAPKLRPTLPGRHGFAGKDDHHPLMSSTPSRRVPDILPYNARRSGYQPVDLCDRDEIGDEIVLSVTPFGALGTAKPVSPSG